MSDKDSSLVQSVERLIGAAAEFGAAIARAADKTTANGREPAAGPPGETAVGAIVRHGVSTAANLVTQIAEASQSVRAAAGAAPASARDESPAGAPRPVVRPGATLRVPLSIENPGQEGTMEITPTVLSWTHNGSPTAAPAAVKFAPANLSVAPRDFEKLTVSVELADDAEHGDYQLEIKLGDGTQTALSFRVVAAET